MFLINVPGVILSFLLVQFAALAPLPSFIIYYSEVLLCTQTPPDFTREGDSPNEIFPSLLNQKGSKVGPILPCNEIGLAL